MCLNSNKGASALNKSSAPLCSFCNIFKGCLTLWDKYLTCVYTKNENAQLKRKKKGTELYFFPNYLMVSF